MPLNVERSGHRYPAYFYEVGWEKVREYALATFVPETRYQDDSSPPTAGADVAVPPTFAACITGRVIPMVVDDPELGGHWNLLHTAQSFEFHRPVRVGDTLRCSPSISDITSRRNMDVLTVAVDVSDAHDAQPVLTATSTLVFFDQEQT